MRYLTGFSLIFAIGILSSCGLEAPYIPLAKPAEAVGYPATNVFAFTHNPQNSGNDFQGYEVYYKYYDRTGDLSSRYDQDVIVIEEATPTNIVSVLNSRGFERVVKLLPGSEDVIDTVPPLIPIPDDALENPLLQILLDFTIEGGTTEEVQTAEVSYLDIEFRIFRTVNGEPESFFEFDPENDDDLSESVVAWLRDNSSIDIALVAFSYGRSLSSGGSSLFNVVRSEATNLERITLFTIEVER